jgi:hypothetical protein
MKHANKTVQMILTSCFVIIGLVSFFVSPKAAYACSTCAIYQQALELEFKTHENWMDNQWWSKYVEPALKSFADENRNANFLETVVYGAFLDVQNLMTAQRALQELSSDTLKNYTPSDTICKFGTLSRSLALSQSKGKANQLVMSKRSINRQLGQAGTSSAQTGEVSDRTARLKQFQKDYCDAKDFGGGMKTMCIGTPSDTRLNADINYTRSVDTKNTLNVDFTDTTETDDEKDIIALANNLYAHKVFSRIDAGSLGQDSKVDTQSTFLDQRAVVAKRSVAENSFNEIVGQKSAGSTGSKTYMLQVLQSLGLDATAAGKYLGTAPSYDAQMEVLTKKIYQDPAFYASLMDSPANVNRQYAALQSFGLMQKRDIFETVSRSEILMSLLLEMEIAKYQDNIQNRQNNPGK